MDIQELIDQLVQLEKLFPNDYEFGGLVRLFIRQNFEKINNEKIKDNNE